MSLSTSGGLGYFSRAFGFRGGIVGASFATALPGDPSLPNSPEFGDTTFGGESWLTQSGSHQDPQSQSGNEQLANVLTRYHELYPNDRLFQLGTHTGLLFRMENWTWWNWYLSNGEVITDDRGDARNPDVIYIDPSHDLDTAAHSIRQALIQLYDDKRSAIQGYEIAWDGNERRFKRVTKQREVSDVVPPTKRTKRTCIILGRLFSVLGAVGLSR